MEEVTAVDEFADEPRFKLAVIPNPVPVTVVGVSVPTVARWKELEVNGWAGSTEQDARPGVTLKAPLLQVDDMATVAQVDPFGTVDAE